MFENGLFSAVNLALNKPVVQSSSFSRTKWGPEVAVDGVTWMLVTLFTLFTAMFTKIVFLVTHSDNII